MTFPSSPPRFLGAGTSAPGPPFRRLAVFLWVAASLAASGLAQGSRERIIDVVQAQKQKEARAKRIGVPLYPLQAFGRAFEKGLIRVETEHLRERAAYWMEWLPTRGITPIFGGLGERAGFGGGFAYSAPALPGGTKIELGVKVSTKLYQEYSFGFATPLLANDRLFVRATTNYRTRTQEDFFGVGFDAPQSARSNFKLQDRGVSLTLGSRVRKHLEAGVSVGYVSARVFSGENPSVPSLEEVFNAANLPGFQGGAEYLSSEAFLAYDNRSSTWDPKGGGLIRLSAASYDGVDRQDFGWVNYRFELQRFQSIVDDDHVLAFRFIADLNDEKGGSQIPFFKLNQLGGRYSMRGYRVHRFTDANSLLANLEYRYAIWPRWMDAILFGDAGQVVPEPGQFDGSRLRANWGVGFKVKTEKSALMRFDVAKSGEGTRFYVTVGSSF